MLHRSQQPYRSISGQEIVQEVQEALSDVGKLKLEQHFFDPSRRPGKFTFNPKWSR
jgi:hypothetical protein